MSTDHYSYARYSCARAFLTIFCAVFLCVISISSAQAQLVLDHTFTGGVTDATSNGFVSEVMPDGKILAGGNFGLTNGGESPTLVMLNPDGTRDLSFNAGNVGPNGVVYAIIRLSDGKIILGGGFTTYNGTLRAGIARLNSDGTLDDTFNPGGSGTVGTVQGITVQVDGKYLLSGVLSSYNGTARFSVIRVNVDGTLDASFTSPFTNAHFVEQTGVQSDGKIVIGGALSVGGYTYAARLNVNGSLDTSFNPGGSGPNRGVFALQVLGDNKILIGGEFSTFNGTARKFGARLNADGTLDNSFVPTPVNGSGAEFFAVQPNGQVLVAGGFDDGTGIHGIALLNTDGSLDDVFDSAPMDNTGYHITRQSDGKILLSGLFNTVGGANHRNLVRLNADGSTDTSFNANFSTWGLVNSILQQPDAKIVVGGNFANANGVSHASVARFNPDGSLDSTFSTGAGVTGLSFVTVNSVVRQSDGKLIVGGQFNNYNGVPRRSLMRLNADGSLDTSFTAAAVAGDFTTIYQVLIQGDGKIVVAGLGLGSSLQTIVRLNADGTLDNSFTFGNGDGNVQRLIQQPDGKLIAIGNFTVYGGQNRRGIYRLNTDGTVDSSFNPGTGANGTISSILLQSDGKMFIGGSFTSFNGTTRTRIARLNADGSLDSSFDPGSGANGSVLSIVIQPNGKIAIAGSFSQYNGVSRNRLAWITSSGAADVSENSGFDGDPRFFARRLLVGLDGKLYVAGSFRAYSGAGHSSVLRLHTPEVSGGTQPILFVTNRNGNNDIYRMNADGTNQQQLTNAPEGEQSAQWSPDGTRILYTKVIDSISQQVWMMNADGSNKSLISNPAGYNAAIDWSPDGHKVLFMTSTSTTQASLWTMDADGGNKLRITNSAMLDHFAKWSPDSSKVAFGRCNPSFVCDIYVVNSDGTGETNLTPSSPDDDDSPVWIENGLKIIYGHGSDSFYDLYVINSDGSNVQRLTNTVSPIAHYIDGGLSPDGRQLAYGRLSTAGSATDSANSREIWVMNVDGTSQTGITNNSVYDFFGAWSPDSSKIAFQSRRDSAASEIYVTAADGSGVQRLTFNNATDTVTDWYAPPASARSRSRADFDGDGKTDVSVYRPSEGNWYVYGSRNGFSVVNWGNSTDVQVPADFDGDGKADSAIYRPSTGEWYVLQSSNGSYSVTYWGNSTDKPLSRDFDGDGKADIAVYRPSTGEWFIFRSSDGGADIVTWGLATDVPVPADYDGDGKTDIAVYRPSNGNWYVLASSGGGYAAAWGVPGDKPVPADFDGDKKDDMAIYRPSEGNWYILRSTDQGYDVAFWGNATDVPVPGDYDGDGKDDVAQFRPSTGQWYILRSTSGYDVVSWGITNDQPTPAAYIP